MRLQLGETGEPRWPICDSVTATNVTTSHNILSFSAIVLLSAPSMQTASRPASTSTRSGPSPLPRPYLVNTQTKILDSVHGRILCIADIRGRHSALNDIAREANAKAIIHTGDFGFFGMHLLLFLPHSMLLHPCPQSLTAWTGSTTVLFVT